MLHFLAVLLLTISIAGSAAKSAQPQEQPQGIQGQPAADYRGTPDAPLVVKVLPTPKTNEDAAQDKADRDDVSAANWWMVRLTGVIGCIGIVQAVVFWIQAGRLKETVNKMDEIARSQANDTQATIAAAGRSATAMEHVAEAMAANVVNVKESVAISRTISERQTLITELQSRAYLSVAFWGMVPQNTNTGIRFEPRMTLVNNGNTPAYKVSFRTAADVLPLPLPSDFSFPLPDVLPHRSISTIGPRLNKVLSAVVPKIYPDVEVKQIQAGAGQRIYMWGLVTYEDAFGIARNVKFSQSFFWLEDGKSVMSSDTAYHNDAD